MAIYKFNYLQALYRKDNNNQPCVWYAQPYTMDSVKVIHGIVGKTLTEEIIQTRRDVNKEIASRISAKRKTGYKYLNEIKDNVHSPVEGELIDYLSAYLPNQRTTADCRLLPMKAKVYDNTNNKLFKRCPTFLGQWKINGLRCFITAKINNGDLFKPISLVFQSCEGEIWNSLGNLEEYLLSVIPQNFLMKMIDDNIGLDGEVYLPGYTVNNINHFVKDASCKENKLLQYWCYDIAVADTSQFKRLDYLFGIHSKDIKVFKDKYEHLNNTDRFVVLPCYPIYSDNKALIYRDKFIELGFEGLILRNPDAEYQYGKRNLSMIKFKKSTDGKFKIVDIYPEGIKRSHIPLFKLKNDINDATFEVHIGGSQEYQSSFLKEDVKRNIIGKLMFVEYGERSGINDLPFHVKAVKLLE